MVSLPSVMVSPATLPAEQAEMVVATRTAAVAARVRQIVLREVAMRSLLKKGDKNVSILPYF